MGQQVTRYELTVNGTRAETRPLVSTEVSVEHRLEGLGLDAAVVSQALARGLQPSPVVVMVGRAARVTHSYRVVDTATGRGATGQLGGAQA